MHGKAGAIDDTAVRSADILRALQISDQALASHVFRPDNVAAAALKVELRSVADGNKDPADPPPSGFFYRLNVEKLGHDLHLLLSNCVDGYSYQLRRRGVVLLDEQWRWARRPLDGGIHWAADVKMHVASVSKLITAMALTKLLRDKGISPDSSISPWLPGYWQRGPGIDRLSFRQLLTHQSNLTMLAPLDAGPSDFAFMKNQIALGAGGIPAYRNMNYGLCRILIAVIDGSIPYTLFGSTLGDAFWDKTTIASYARYVQANVLDPVGVTSAFTHGAGDALAYPFPAIEPGWDSNDLSTASGFVGWHLSVDDMLRIMAAFRRRGLIVDPAVAEQMLDRQIGLDRKFDTPLGRIYAKGGFWSTDKGTFVEQSNAIFLPKGMELVILANSPFCKPDAGFMNDVLNTIVANIESVLLKATIAAVSVFAAAGLVRRLTASTTSRRVR